MKRENLILIGAFACFVFLCFFMRYEMERSRAQLSSDFHQEIAKAPASILNAVSDSVKQVATNLDATAAKAPGDTSNASGIVQDIAGVIKNTIAPVTPALTNATSPSPDATNNDLEGLGVRILDAATQTAKKVDRVGLDATRMSDEEESRYGKQLAESMAHDFKIMPDSPEYARINRLMAPILEERQRRSIQYMFYVIDSKVVNAFSLAGGHVYITTGFLHEFPADASVVMALSHEVGHIDLRHCAEKVQYAHTASKAVGGVAQLGGYLYNTLSIPYTKDQEFAADEYGYLACRKSGWPSADLIALFTQLDAYEHRKGFSNDPSDADSRLGGKLRNYFTSHPPTAERKMRLEKLASR